MGKCRQNGPEAGGLDTAVAVYAAPSEPYSTVTVFARLRGWSTFSPRVRATW
jgi:hypothetical protein